MTRDLRRLAETRFDLLIVGAGFYGVTAAWDAAQRGLSVAIIDRGDIGGATSFNNHKTIHGGVRSLQQANLSQMRLFVRERRALTTIAPHLVHPLPFLVPTYRTFLRSRTLMRLGLELYNFLARDRNDLRNPASHLPRARVISREECLRLHPAIDPAGVTGGAVWHDCQMYSTDRVTLAFLLSAVEAGATAANYVEAQSFLLDASRVRGVRARDRIRDEEIDIQARVVVNAAGPWASTLLRRLPILPHGDGRTYLSKAMNLVTRPVANEYAIGGLVGSRFLFAVPWRGYTVIGTSHDVFHGPPDALRVTRKDVAEFLAEVNAAFPRARLTPDDVRLVHRGLLPAVSGSRGQVRLLKESRIDDHRREGVEGLLTVIGVRYTTARHTAQQVVDAVFGLLGKTAPRCRTADTPLAGGRFASFDQLMAGALRNDRLGIARETLKRLALCYGSAYESLLRPMVDDPSLAEPIGAACQVTRAEIRHAARHEMAVRLSDAVLRRTEAGSAEHPGAEALRGAAAVMAAELGWSDARIRDEIEAVDRFYRIDD